MRRRGFLTALLALPAMPLVAKVPAPVRAPAGGIIGLITANAGRHKLGFALGSTVGGCVGATLDPIAFVGEHGPQLVNLPRGSLVKYWQEG